MPHERKFFRKSDVITISVVVALGLALWLAFSLYTRNIPPLAEIYLGEKLMASVALDEGEELTFSVAGMENVIFEVYADGSIAFVASDCPDKVCVRSGKLSRVGQSAACLPNKLILKIIDRDKNTEGNMDLII